MPTDLKVSWNYWWCWWVIILWIQKINTGRTDFDKNGKRAEKDTSIWTFHNTFRTKENKTAGLVLASDGWNLVGFFVFWNYLNWVWLPPYRAWSSTSCGSIRPGGSTERERERECSAPSLIGSASSGKCHSQAFIWVSSHFCHASRATLCCSRSLCTVGCHWQHNSIL